MAFTACSSPIAKTEPKNEGGKGKVVLVTHDDFKLPENLIKELKEKEGINLVISKLGSGPKLVSALALRKNNPVGDLVFGLATNDMGRVAQEGFIDPTEIKVPAEFKKFMIPSVTGAVPMDRGDVCVNIDTKWFAKKKLAEPQNFKDLTKPEYKGLFVTIDPQKTTGFGFLAATIAKFPNTGWEDYWKALKANDTKVDGGWTEAYTVDFTAGGGNGKFPIVVSYSTSPAFTVNKEVTETSTKALLDTCYLQSEFAGVLKNAKNPVGARKVIEWLASEKVQAAFPDNMYVNPINTKVTLPKSFNFVKIAPNPLTISPEEVAKESASWLKTWNGIMKG